MYESYYGFKQKPFQITPDPDFLYMSPNHDHALQYLEYGLEHNIGIILLSGEVGAGKTTLIQYLRRQIDQNIEMVILSNTNLKADQLLAYVLLELGIEPEELDKARNLALFKAYLQALQSENRRVILIIDESQNLPKDALEEIRMLSNYQADDGLPLQIFLFGQPEIRAILRSPGMHQIRQRIAVNYHLNGLSEEETVNYIQYRLEIAGARKNPFTLDAAKLIFKATSGIPRTINILCDSSLLYGFAEEAQAIDEKIVTAVLNELNLHSFVQPDGQALNFPEEGGHKNGDVLPSGTAHENGTQTDKLVKKSYKQLKQRLDKIEVKMDQLRDEIFQTINQTLLGERRRAEDLMIENATLKAVIETLRPAGLSKKSDKKQDAATAGSDETDSGDHKRNHPDRKIYKLDN